MTADGRTPFPARLAWHARLAARASRLGAAVALAGGFATGLVLRVTGAWLAGAVAATAAALAVLCIAFARRPLDSVLARTQAPEIAMEQAGAADQVAHGLARAALVLGCFFLGLWAADASGLGRA